jgi:ADP-dependent NAD(P)H-hydrate dehydratase / NAD(P)H-hydrate epimerase
MESLFSIAQIRLIEKTAIEKYGIDEFSLMKHAGEAAFTFLLENWPHIQKIAVFCGPGNNGGDGFVLAKLAHDAGLFVTVRTIGDVSRLKHPALQAYEECSKSKIPIQPFDHDEYLSVELIVDAILGIGLKKEVTGDLREAIIAINKSNLPVIAIDVPSGLDADLGNCMGVAVKADVTATFLGLKRGFLTNDGQDFCGKIYCSDLNVPAVIYKEVGPSTYLLSKSFLNELFLPRKKNSQKGNFGHVLIMGGNIGMGGAARLAAQAALRVGAGLVSVASRPENLALIMASYPEIMCHGVLTSEDLQPLLERATVLVVGPGLGRDDWARMLLMHALTSSQPKLIDADGLNLLGPLPSCGDNWVMTPHPGEAARLLAMKSPSDVQKNRFKALNSLKKLGGTWVLKGAGTLISAGETTFLCPFGNPGMASGGMGDALSGIIGGLIAQKYDLAHAASLGVLVHALAGDLAAEKGERGLVASDLIANIRELVNPKLQD